MRLWAHVLPNAIWEPGKRLKQCRAFDKAVRFIKNAPSDGYHSSFMKNSYSFDCVPNQNNGERIDIEIQKGSAFVGY